MASASNGNNAVHVGGAPIGGGGGVPAVVGLGGQQIQALGGVQQQGLVVIHGNANNAGGSIVLRPNAAGAARLAVNNIENGLSLDVAASCSTAANNAFVGDCNISESNTCLETVHVLHKWRIENFSIHSELAQVGDCLNSTLFGSTDNQYKFVLRLYPIGKDEECRGYVSLFLQIRDCPAPKARFRVNFFVETTEAEWCKRIGFDNRYKLFLSMQKETTVEKISKMRRSRPTARFSSFCPRGCALNRNIVTINKGGIVTASRFFSVDFLKQRNQRFLPDDCLTVGCELYIFGDAVSQMKREESVPVPTSTLVDDLSQMLRDQKHTDCQIVVQENTTFKAHKAVLAARSQVFAAMFDHKDMLEGENSRVQISDITAEAFEALLQHIYCDDATEQVNIMPDEVLIAADKYALDRLRAQCEAVLCQDLNTSNVCHRLKLADLYSATTLKSKALAFIREYSHQVLASDGWSSLENECPRLAANILKEAMMQSTSSNPPSTSSNSNDFLPPVTKRPRT